MRWGPKAVLLDDDDLILRTWAISAKGSRVSLSCFKDKESLFKALADMERRVDVFLDSKLGDGVKGEDIAKELFDLGFRNIYLETGLPPDAFPKCHWIKGILSKDPPWGA